MSGEPRALPVIHVHLELGQGDPIAGRVWGTDGSPRSFTGWLDLVVALEAARTNDDTPTSTAHDEP